MEMFQLTLTKSYIVTIKAKSEEEARLWTEFFTDDISDISTETDKNNHNFSIEKIECTLNETFDCQMIKNR